MHGRFFAMEMGCPDEEPTVYMNSDGSMSLVPPGYNEAAEGSGEAPEGVAMVCECRGLGCKKCKRKKAKTVTLTGGRAPVPVMNVARMPMAPWTPSMIMLGKSSIF